MVTVPDVTYTVSEAAQRLGLSYRTIWNAVKAGNLPSTRDGWEYRIAAAALEDFARARYPRRELRPIERKRSSAAYSLKELAALLGVHERTVYREVRRGRLAGFKVASEYRVSQEALDAYVRGEYETTSPGQY